MDLPVRGNAKTLKTFISFQKFPDSRKGVTYMVYTHLCVCIRVETIWSQHAHVCKRKSMVFVIVGKECERRILVLHLCLEDFLIPVEHFIVASGHVDHVGQFGRGQCFLLLPQLMIYVS